MMNNFHLRYVAFFFSIIVLFIVSFKLTVADNSFKCIQSERQALLSFKHGLVDSNGMLLSWTNQNEDCCIWRGVKCSNVTNRITALHLRGSFDQSLSGTIGLSLAELSHLQYLDLSNNDLRDVTIPRYIGSFVNLAYLNLSHNRFSGITPHLGNLSSLHTLDLSGSPFVQSSKSLEWLSGLHSLQHLDLSYVNLENASDWIQVIDKLPHLKSLSLSSCLLPPDPAFESYPYNNNISTSLSKLELYGNYLTSSIFPWLSNFNTTLVHLDLSDNDLQGHIPSFSTVLVYLDLSDNLFQGYIPNTFGNMTFLSYIDFSFNLLEGASPKSFWNSCGLQSLAFPGNKLKGAFSDFLQLSPSCGLNSVQYLDFFHNKFSGPLPNFSSFLDLEFLDLSFNGFSGTVPISLGQLSNLETLYLGHNSLEGTVLEAHFLKLTKLKMLDLSHNSLSFHPQSHWVPPFEAKSLFLSCCRLGPKFPNWLQGQNLSALDISNASISDTVPHWLWNLFPNSFILDLSYNKMKGQLPTLSKGFKGIGRFVNLRRNEFEGQIPPFLLRVFMLDISNNMFSGLGFLCRIDVSPLSSLDASNNRFLEREVPNCWGKLSNLAFLNLGSNNFSRGIPSSLRKLQRLQFLHLSNNSFSGEFPSWMENFNQLRVLDLEGNELSGPIPAWIGTELSNLAFLSLRSNRFHGELPSTLCHLQNIQFLDLSMNTITGGIPRCIDNLDALTNSSSLSNNEDYFTNMNAVGSRHYALKPIEEMIMTWKGRELIMRQNLRFLKGIDFSGNHLTGTIPNAITNLVQLVSLNLSRNNLTGGIPRKIGQLKSLDFLDLSRNELKGQISSSLSEINGLSVLDLSYNKLSGKIPTGTQLQSFNASTYVGNDELCGSPLPKCRDDEMAPNPTEEREEDDENESATRGFYISLATGFVVGFWGIFGSLMLHRPWRHAYFGFLSDLHDWFYVKVAIFRNKVQNLFRN